MPIAAATHLVVLISQGGSEEASDCAVLGRRSCCFCLQSIVIARDGAGQGNPILPSFSIANVNSGSCVISCKLGLKLSPCVHLSAH